MSRPFFNNIIQHTEDTEFFKKKAVTKQYDHSRPINLKKLPSYYISRINGDLVFSNKIYKFHSNVTNTLTVSYVTETNKIEMLKSWDEFTKIFTYYDQKHPQYQEILDKVQTEIRNKMTPDEFFNQCNIMTADEYFNQTSNKRYSRDWNMLSYDIINNSI